MTQFLKSDKLPFSMYTPLCDCNVLSKSIHEASASSSASSGLPVIRLQKLAMSLGSGTLSFLFWTSMIFIVIEIIMGRK